MEAPPPPPEGVSVLTCFNCSLNLTGHRYILRDDKPFCIKCYEDLFANKCEECKQAIGTDFKVSNVLIISISSVLFAGYFHRSCVVSHVGLIYFFNMKSYTKYT